MTDTEVKEQNRDDRSSRSSDDGDGKFQKRNPRFKKKVCRFCIDKSAEEGLNYKRIDILERFITNRGKILPRRISGTCGQHQRAVAREIKKARSIGLLPFKIL